MFLPDEHVDAQQVDNTHGWPTSPARAFGGSMHVLIMATSTASPDNRSTCH